jgi:hypothetical protein
MKHGKQVGTQGKKENTESKEMKRLDWVAYFTGLLVIVGAIQVWTFIVTERALVTPSKVSLDTTRLAANRPLVINIEVKNSGHTAAFVIDTNITALWTPNELPAKPAYQPMRKMLVVGPMVPGEPNRINFRASAADGAPVIISPALVTAIEAGQTRLYVIGFIRYYDGYVFNLLSHTTGFCFGYNPSADDPSYGMWENCGNNHYEYAN